MTNDDLIKIYCDGAAMAYRDVENQIKSMIDKCPPEIGEIIVVLYPLQKACEMKAAGVHNEAACYKNANRQ